MGIMHAESCAARLAGCLTACCVLATTLVGHATAQPARASLDIYWIDVEGGAATLIVTPAGQSILMDAGWNRDDARDAGRIQAALRDAGVEQLDFFIASHFHEDHVGGLQSLAERMPIGQLVDHGDSVEQTSERGRAYRGKRISRWPATAAARSAQATSCRCGAWSFRSSPRTERRWNAR